MELAKTLVGGVVLRGLRLAEGYSIPVLLSAERYEERHAGYVKRRMLEPVDG